MTGRAWSMTWLLGAWCSAAACGHAASRDTLQREQLSRAEAVEAARLSPELFAQYRAASELAAAEKAGSAARADYETEARFWLEAATVDAQRVQLSAERLELERNITTLEAEALENEQARAVLAEQAEYLSARELARAEEELVLARAALAPHKRVKLAPAEIEEAAEALRTRAALVVLALEAYGVPEARLADTRSKLQSARTQQKSAPDQALREADDALFSALSLLSEMRTHEGQRADELSRAVLAEAITQSGAKLARNDRGMAAQVEQAYAQRGLTTRGEWVLDRLCRVAVGASMGPVQLEVQSRTLGSAEQRAKLVRTRLSKLGCGQPRFRVTAQVAESEGLEMTWLAY